MTYNYEILAHSMSKDQGPPCSLQIDLLRRHVALGGPEQRINDHANEVRVLEIIGMPQRRVEDPATLVFPYPGDRLGVIGNGAGHQNDNIFVNVRVLVEAACG